MWLLPGFEGWLRVNDVVNCVESLIHSHIAKSEELSLFICEFNYLSVREKHALLLQSGNFSKIEGHPADLHSFAIGRSTLILLLFDYPRVCNDRISLFDGKDLFNPHLH